MHRHKISAKRRFKKEKRSLMICRQKTVIKNAYTEAGRQNLILTKVGTAKNNRGNPSVSNSSRNRAVAKKKAGGSDAYKEWMCL